MQCLAMTTIAAFIGAKGLGFNLKVALNSLKIGKAAEIGICVVIIAVVLDKLSLAWANKQKDYFANLNFYQKNKTYIAFVILTLLGIILSYLGAFYFKDGINYLYYIPLLLSYLSILDFYPPFDNFHFFHKKKPYFYLVYFFLHNLRLHLNQNK